MFWLTLAWTERNGQAVEQEYGFIDPARLVRYLAQQAYVGANWSRTRIVRIAWQGIGSVLVDGRGPVDPRTRDEA